MAAQTYLLQHKLAWKYNRNDIHKKYAKDSGLSKISGCLKTLISAEQKPVSGSLKRMQRYQCAYCVFLPSRRAMMSSVCFWIPGLLRGDWSSRID